MKRKTAVFACIALLCFLFASCGKTKEPEPSAPIPDMAFAEVQEKVTAKEETNLRNFPSQGEESRVLFTLKNGEAAERTGISETGWSRLTYDGKVCYAVSSYLTTDLSYVPSVQEEEDGIDTVFSQVQETVTAKDVVNLRSLPSVTGTESCIVAELRNGETAERTGISENGWSRLSYREMTCYAVSSYLTTDLSYMPGGAAQEGDGDGIKTAFSPVEETVTAKDVVNLRSLPSVTNSDSKIIGQLKNGDTAVRKGISENGWSKLYYQDEFCYAVSSYLTTDLNYDGSSEKSEGNGEIRTQFRQTDEQVTAKIEVNLRSAPSVTDSEVIAALKNGTPARRTGINEDVGWSRVEYEGQILYCVSSYLIQYSGS